MHFRAALIVLLIGSVAATAEPPEARSAACSAGNVTATSAPIFFDGYIERLTDFYRGIQLQGFFAGDGQGLMEIPNYLVSEEIDIKYRNNPKLRREIPFVDFFSINRFLGGHPQELYTKIQKADVRLGKRTFDYAISGQ
jgi:hypothetical protein